MRLFKLLLAVASISLFVASCSNTSTNTNTTANINTRPSAPMPVADSTPAAAPAADEVAAGRATYQQFCIRCHKPDGAGGLFEEEDGSKLKVPTLREGHAVKHADKELVAKINNGGDGMPRFKGRLDDAKIDELVRFIRKEFQPQSASPVSNAPTAPVR
ncbi:MAG: cytochrome c [Pyrinomonadaceae bacterium]